ncbi:hypothetical protein GFD17_01325 [Bifidobacterium sp. SMB2]|uniref:Uncharacterized protein n=1 Tax=Bifidobacterium saimiriisciurei TaxID=2661627 RepID=A0ABX0C8C2_9BIFI|nr:MULTISPECIES: hypothetical protein [Bifidobacterium]NEG95417.1 hypothetical protein [Bifidobacterium sp. SMB2]NEH11399.1 hypothetical protein [Bifidobacterium saimiriisciurei]
MPERLAKPEKFCPKCGALRGFGTQFCMTCGYRFPLNDADGNAADGGSAAFDGGRDERDIPQSPAEITVVSQTGSIPPVQDAPAMVTAAGAVPVAVAPATPAMPASDPAPAPATAAPAALEETAAFDPLAELDEPTVPASSSATPAAAPAPAPAAPTSVPAPPATSPAPLEETAAFDPLAELDEPTPTASAPANSAIPANSAASSSAAPSSDKPSDKPVDKPVDAAAQLIPPLTMFGVSHEKTAAPTSTHGASAPAAAPATVAATEAFTPIAPTSTPSPAATPDDGATQAMPTIAIPRPSTGSAPAARTLSSAPTPAGTQSMATTPLQQTTNDTANTTAIPNGGNGIASGSLNDDGLGPLMMDPSVGSASLAALASPAEDSGMTTAAPNAGQAVRTSVPAQAETPTPASASASASDDQATAVIKPIGASHTAAPLPKRLTGTGLAGINKGSKTDEPQESKGLKALKDLWGSKGVKAQDGVQGPKEPSGTQELPRPKTPPNPKSPAKPKRPLDAKCRRIIMIAVICVVALVLGGGGYALWARHQHATALADCTAAQANLTDAKKALDATLENVKSTAGIDKSKLADASTLTDLKGLIDEGAAQKAPADPCASNLSTRQLTDNTTTVSAKAKAFSTLNVQLNKASKAVQASQEKKLLDDARASLVDTYAKAEKLISDATGKVADASTLTALKQAATAAKKIVAGGEGEKTDVDEINTQIKALQAAMTKVNESVKAKQAADAKKKADKTHCATIAGGYSGFKVSMSLTVKADCSVTWKPSKGNSTDATYVAESYKGSDGTYTWKLSNGKTVTLYPAGKSSPIITKAYSGDKSKADELKKLTAKTTIETDGKAYTK